ncbi:MAG: sporulation protein YabP [Clostridia bacterium]|nr:sporulation protein YabP [Clostridia bacterium]
MDRNNHSIRLDDRKKLVIEGVSDVVSFDDLSVVLDTLGGRLNINGEDLHIQTLCLESGLVEVVGRIDEMMYEDNNATPKRGLFGRLAR